MSKINESIPGVQHESPVTLSGAPLSGPGPGTSSASAGAPAANFTAALACLVLIGIAWLVVSAAVVEFAAGLGASWAVEHGGGIIFAPLFGALAVCSWYAVSCRLRGRRYAAAAWWAAFSCLPSILTLQIAGVL